MPSRSAARAIATASIGSDLPRSRAELARAGHQLRRTRTTRSPRATRKRSSAPETWRQSSIAHTRSPLERRAPSQQVLERAAARPRTVRSAARAPVAASTAADGVGALVRVRPDHDHLHRPFVGSLTNGSPADTSQSGRCHAPIRSRRDPRTAAGDTTSRSDPGRHKSMGQPVAGPRTYRSRRTPPPDPAHSLTEKVKSAGGSGSCGNAAGGCG